MSYLNDVYRKRVAPLGTSADDQHLKMSKEFFKQYLTDSPNKRKIIINNREIDCVILSNSEDENKITKILLVQMGTGLKVSDLIIAGEENYILLKKFSFSYQAYDKFIILETNHRLRWVDDIGIAHSVPAFVKSTMETFGTNSSGFKIADNLILPSPNRGAIAVLPTSNINNKQRFIINGQGWIVSERDLVSVDGLMYLSLHEIGNDLASDDIEEEITNIAKLENTYIDVGFSTVSLQIGESFIVEPMLMKDGYSQQATFTLYANTDFVTIEGMEIIPIVSGEHEVDVVCNEYPDIVFTIIVNVQEETVVSTTYSLLGDNNIKWGRTRTYTLIQYNNGVAQGISASFTIDNDELLEILSIDNNSCTVKAGNSKIGTVMLTAHHANGSVSKEINVVSLWG